MTTTPTQLPVPSEKPQDLKFNAGKIDEFVTSVAKRYIDRFGGEHYTIEGLKSLALQAIYNLGLNPIGSFQAGVTVTGPGDIVQDTSTGVWYRWDDLATIPKTIPPTSTPGSTGGTGDGKWLAVDVSDVLRKDLAGDAGTEFIGDESGLTLKERLHFDESDISLYGYTYGSGLDAKSAILSAINRTGKAHLSGATTLSRFDWPQGARLTGKASITYTRVPGVPCELDSNADILHLKENYIMCHQEYDICDMLQMKTAGFNILIHYGQFGSGGGTMTKACNAAESIGMKIVLGGTTYGQTDTPSMDLDSRNCVIGYYLYDEPQHNSVTKANQDQRITNFKSVTNKQLYITDNGIWSFDNQSISNGYNGIGYDVIFVDNYYHDDWDDSRNKRQAVIGWAELKYKAKNARLIPCLGLFTTNGGSGSDNFKNKAKQISFAKSVYGLGDGAYAAFSWASNLIAPTHKTITTDSDLYALACQMNSKEKQSPYMCEAYVFYTDVLGGALQAYNDKYSSQDVTPWQTINSGSGTSDRNTTFKRGGIAVKNTGGVMATRLKNGGYIAVELYFYNGADSSNTGAGITTCIDDFFTNSDQMSTTFTSSTTSWINAVETTPNLGVGLRLTPATSYQWRWKLISGGIVDCSWRGSTF